MEREREIRAFIPETYFTISADTLTEKKTALPLSCAEEPKVVEEAESQGVQVKDIAKFRPVIAPLLFEKKKE